MVKLRFFSVLLVGLLIAGGARATGESTWTWNLEHVAFATWSYNSTTHQFTFTYPSGWTVEDVHLSVDGSRVLTVVPGTSFTFLQTSISAGHRVDIVAKKVLGDGSRQWIVTPMISRFCDDFLAPFRSPDDTNCVDPAPEPTDSITPENDCDGAGQDGINVSVTCTGDNVTGGTDDSGAYCQSETTTTTGGTTTTTTTKTRKNCGTIQNGNPDEPAPPSP